MFCVDYIENNKCNSYFSVCVKDRLCIKYSIIVGVGGYVQATPGVDKPYGTPRHSFQTIQEVFDFILFLNNTSFGNRRTVAGAI